MKGIGLFTTRGFRVEYIVRIRARVFKLYGKD